MAFAYDDAGLPIAVATLDGANTFSGPITFSNATASTSTSTGAVVISGGLGVQGNIYGSKVWGCVWNDLVDCIDVPESTDNVFIWMRRKKNIFDLRIENLTKGE